MEKIISKKELINLGVKRIFPDLCVDILSNIEIELDGEKMDDIAEAHIDENKKITINGAMAKRALEKTFGDNNVSDSLLLSYFIYLYTHESLHYVLKHFSRYRRFIQNNKKLVESVGKHFELRKIFNIEVDIELNHIVFNSMEFIFDPVFKGQNNEKEKIWEHLKKGYCYHYNVHNQDIEKIYNEIKDKLSQQFDYKEYFTDTHVFEHNMYLMLCFLEKIKNDSNFQNIIEEIKNMKSEKCFQRELQFSPESEEKENQNKEEQNSGDKNFDQKNKEEEIEKNFSEQKLKNDMEKRSKEAGSENLKEMLEKINEAKIKKINIKDLLKNLKTTIKVGAEYESFSVLRASALSRKEISPKVILEEEKDGNISIIVDTSGSVFSPDIFGRFVKMFEQIVEYTSKESIKIFVIFIDTQINEIIEIKEKESVKKSLEKFVKNVKGGGGTDLNPAIKHIIKDKKLKNSKLIFTITDGYLSSNLMRTKIKNIVLMPENDYLKEYLNGSPWFLF
jgi:hypothetical protein